jgi:hypothetical protein
MFLITILISLKNCCAYYFCTVFKLKNETCKATDNNTVTGCQAMILQKTFIQDIHITFCGVITFMCDDI